MKEGKLNISRQDFVGMMDEIRKQNDFVDSLNKLFDDYGVDCHVYSFDSLDVAITALHLAVGDADKNEWISYYCWELDFGRAWEPGYIVDKDGNEFKLQTPEDLYDLLVVEVTKC